jgi:hypothetical protein
VLSVARIQAYLGTSGDVAYLTELEAAAVADVQAITGRFLGAAGTAFVDVCDGPALPAWGLTAPESPDEPHSVRLSQPVALAGITSVKERANPAEQWEAVALVTTDVPPIDVFEMRYSRLYRLIGWWPVGPRTVQVSFTFGYATDGAPAAFNGVVLDLIAARFRPAGMRAQGSIKRAQIRGAEVEYVEGGSGGSIPADLYKRILRLRDV